MLDLEKANVSDPTAFWEFIQNIRKNKKSEIPNEVYCEDGISTTCDLQDVLNRWVRDFGSLLTPPESTEEKKMHINEIKEENKKVEQEMLYSPPRPFNCVITEKEVKDAVYKGKTNKAPWTGQHHMRGVKE